MANMPKCPHFSPPYFVSTASEMGTEKLEQCRMKAQSLKITKLLVQKTISLNFFSDMAKMPKCLGCSPCSSDILI